MQILDCRKKLSAKAVPLLLSKIPCGFPSPASDHIETTLDLNEFLIYHQSATFFVRVEGDSMINAGILDGDLLIVDRSIKPEDGSIVVAIIEGEFTVKRLRINSNGNYLYPENDSYQPIKINADLSTSFWGVVIHAIHSFTKERK